MSTAWTPPLRINHGTGRVLPARRDNKGARACLQGRRQPVGDGTVLVDRDRLGPQADGGNQVTDARPARILDRDPVARPQFSLEQPFDPVEGAAHDGDLTGDTVGGEAGPRDLGELRKYRRPTVELVGRIDLRECGTERWQRCRVRVAAGKVAHARRQRPGGPDPQRRLGRDGGAMAPIGLDETAVAEAAVAGRHRRRADAPGQRRACAPQAGARPAAVRPLRSASRPGPRWLPHLRHCQ